MLRALALLLALALAPSCASANPYDSLVAADGATHYWRFSANANDSVGSGNGTIVNGSGGFTFGQTITSLIGGFTNTGTSNITLPVPLTALSSFSTEVWIKTGASLPNSLFGSNQSSAFRMWWFFGNGGQSCSSTQFSMFSYDGSNHDGCSTLSINTIYHIVLSCASNGTNGCIGYINGTSFYSDTINMNFDVGPSNGYLIGNDPFSQGSPFTPGSLGSLAVYPTALSPAQVTAHYQCGIGMTCSAVTAIAPAASVLQ